MFLDMEGDQGLNDGPLVGVQVAAGQQVLGQVSLLVASPGLEGGDELDLIDQAVLQREQPEEEMAVGGGHGDGSVFDAAEIRRSGRAGSGCEI
jgi:hypothetical protein